MTETPSEPIAATVKKRSVRWARPHDYRVEVDGVFCRVSKQAPGRWSWSATNGDRLEQGGAGRLAFAQAAALAAAADIAGSS